MCAVAESRLMACVGGLRGRTWDLVCRVHPHAARCCSERVCVPPHVQGMQWLKGLVHPALRQPLTTALADAALT